MKPYLLLAVIGMVGCAFAEKTIVLPKIYHVSCTSVSRNMWYCSGGPGSGQWKARGPEIANPFKLSQEASSCIVGQEQNDARSVMLEQASKGEKYRGSYLDAYECRWKKGQNPLEVRHAKETCAFFTKAGELFVETQCPSPDADSECMGRIDGHCVIGRGCGSGDMCACNGQDCSNCAHFRSRQACSYSWVDHSGKYFEVTTCDDYTGKPKPCQF